MNIASLYNIYHDGAYDGQQRSLKDFQFDLENALGLGDAGHPCPHLEQHCNRGCGRDCHRRVKAQ